MIAFECTAKERETALQIAERANALNANCDVLHTMMDIIATHVNGCPIDLDGLLAADDLNFSHDVLGIARHLNRETGQLESFFLPRFSVEV